MSPTVEPCRPEDFAGLLPLLHQLWPGPPIDPAAARKVFDRALRSEHQLYLCARVEGKVVGFGSLTCKNNLWPEGPVGNIDELVVDEAHRGRGIGRALLAHLAAAARERGCQRLELDSGMHRIEAHAFYRVQGFEQRALLFSRRT